MIRWLTFGLFLAALSVPLEGPAGEPVKTFTIEGNTFSLDLMGNVYWTRGSTLIKYKTETDEKLEYTNNFLGPVHSFDVSNPLKILVFYKSFNRLVFLDKSLSPIGSPVNLDQMSLSSTLACCTSHKGGFWLFNGTLNRIQHYNTNLGLVQEIPVSTKIRKQSNTAPRLIEKNRRLYCFLPGCCLLSFDRFGNLTQRLPLKNVNNIQILNGNIYYFYENTLKKISGDGMETEKILLPKGGDYWDDARMGEQNQLYLLRRQKLYIYKHQP
jgi:hypothetical protein